MFHFSRDKILDNLQERLLSHFIRLREQTVEIIHTKSALGEFKLWRLAEDMKILFFFVAAVSPEMMASHSHRQR